MIGESRRDLWGNLDDLTEDEPDNAVLALLNEQAEVLREKTQGRIEAQVEPVAVGGSTLMLRFVLVVPRMGGYRYELFRVTQRGLDFPVEITWPGTDNPIECPGEQEFREALGSVLRSESTRRALRNLFAAERNALDV